MTARRTFAVLADASLSIAGCKRDEPPKPAAPVVEKQKPAEVTKTNTDDSLQGDGSDGQWLSYNGRYDATHFSPLTEINDGNVDKLDLAWALDLPVGNSHSSPLAVDGVIYFSQGYAVISAVDALTGKVLWKYDPQVTGKNGFFYVLNRETGKFISGIQWAKQNWAKEIDKNGRPVELPNARPTKDGKLLINYPGGMGAHNWMAMSFSPKTKLVYIPRQDAPYAYSRKGIDEKNFAPSQRLGLASGYAAADTRELPPASETPQGALVAWDPVKGKEAWSVARRAPVNGGTVATAGNLVFQGTADGKFSAYTADTGKEVWSFDAHNGIVGAPITFTAGGKQYISVLTGYGALAAVVGEDSARYNWQYRQQHRRLLTFAIGGTAKLPENEAIPPLTFLDDPSVKLKDADVEKGSLAFARCMVCHGPGAVAGGAAPDLRASPIALQAASFKAIVHGGGLESAGMPKFDELSDEELEQMRSFIRFRARKAIKEAQKL